MNSSGCTERKNKKRKSFLIIRQEDLEFLDGNHCAAALMSVFRNTHKWKVETDIRNKKTNDIAEQNGDARWLSEDVLPRFTIPELLESILHLFGRNAVMGALKLLENKGVITIYTNPNKKYTSDQGRYFRFHPGAYANWLKEQQQEEILDEAGLDEEPIEILPDKNNEILPSHDQIGENLDSLKPNPGEFKNKLDQSSPFKNKRPPFKNKPHIDINNNINKINQSLKRAGDYLKEKDPPDQLENNPSTQAILNALAQKNFPVERFQYADTLESMAKLQQAGATAEDFIAAYEQTMRSKGNSAFAASYLIKVVASKLANKQKPVPSNRPNTNQKETSPCVYENDFNNGLDWMGDLLQEETT